MTVTELVPGLTIEYLHDNQIAIYTLAEMTRSIVDAWIESCDQEMCNCANEGRPILIMQDLSNPRIAQTPYSRERGQALTAKYEALEGRIAFVLPPTTANQRIKLFLRRDAERNRERRAFRSRNEALNWLCEQLPG